MRGARTYYLWTTGASTFATSMATCSGAPFFAALAFAKFSTRFFFYSSVNGLRALIGAMLVDLTDAASVNSAESSIYSTSVTSGIS